MIPLSLARIACIVDSLQLGLRYTVLVGFGYFELVGHLPHIKASVPGQEEPSTLVVHPYLTTYQNHCFVGFCRISSPIWHGQGPYRKVRSCLNIGEANSKLTFSSQILLCCRAILSLSSSTTGPHKVQTF